MFLLKKPSNQKIQHFLASQRDLPFSYREVGASRARPPAGYTVDHNRVRLGAGPATFARAVEALRRWAMFGFGWVQVCWPDTPIAAGSTVVLLARLPGLWSLNACRIVYVIEEDGPAYRYGFAYGTLPGHAERGEERFTVEWRRDDDSVWYDILAFSRPNHLFAFAGYLLARAFQKRFAHASKRAMVEAINAAQAAKSDDSTTDVSR